MNFKESKNAYDQMPIPASLNNKVKEAVNMSKPAASKHISKARIFIYSAAGAAAAAMLTFFVLINTNTSFAATLSDVPVIGNIVTVITGGRYSKINDNVITSINTPEITVTPSLPNEEINKTAAVTAEMLNKQINAAVTEYVLLQEREVEEYKQAFLSTGGTIDEWNRRGIDIKADYEIKYQNGQYLSLYLYMFTSSFAYTQQNKYYNYNFETGRELTLKDILGDNYIETANNSIIAQIKDQIASDSDKIYWGYNSGDGMDDGKFSTITDDTCFYLNSDGNPVICFPKYEIAPGYMGVCEFVIKK